MIALAKKPKQQLSLHRPLINRLARILLTGEHSGQPFVYETLRSSGKTEVLIIWDQWQAKSRAMRVATIAAAAAQANLPTYNSDEVRLVGMTTLEAIIAQRLPYQVLALWRPTDAITLEQCARAMRDEGALDLPCLQTLQLRFPDRTTADACVARLNQRLASSSQIWFVHDNDVYRRV